MSEETTSSEGEARRRLMTPDELRTMPADQMLMIEARSAPLLLTTKLYFQDKKYMERANRPYPVTQVRVEPVLPKASPTHPQGLPPAPAGPSRQEPPIVVDAEVEDDDQFFQQD